MKYDRAVAFHTPRRWNFGVRERVPPARHSRKSVGVYSDRPGRSMFMSARVRVLMIAKLAGDGLLV
jgi:hypothetical protein